MDHIKFLTGIVEIYGAYRSGIEEELILEYLKHNVDEKDLKNLLAKVLIKVDKKYNNYPTIKDFNEILYPVNQMRIKAEKAWQNACKYSSSISNVFFEDAGIQYSIDVAGGWKHFTSRESGEDNMWFKKRFSDAYIIYLKEKPEVNRKVFKCNYDKVKLVMVGDQDKCKQLIDNSKNKVPGMVDKMLENKVISGESK